MKISSYRDFVQVVKTQELNENLVSQLTNGLFGWPLFQDVFAVSALDGSGISELREFILSQGKVSASLLRGEGVYFIFVLILTLLLEHFCGAQKISKLFSEQTTGNLKILSFRLLIYKIIATTLIYITFF